MRVTSDSISSAPGRARFPHVLMNRKTPSGHGQLCMPAVTAFDSAAQHSSAWWLFFRDRNITPRAACTSRCSASGSTASASSARRFSISASAPGSSWPDAVLACHRVQGLSMRASTSRTAPDRAPPARRLARARHRSPLRLGDSTDRRWPRDARRAPTARAAGWRPPRAAPGPRPRTPRGPRGTIGRRRAGSSRAAGASGPPRPAATRRRAARASSVHRPFPAARRARPRAAGTATAFRARSARGASSRGMPAPFPRASAPGAGVGVEERALRGRAQQRLGVAGRGCRPGLLPGVAQLREGDGMAVDEAARAPGAVDASPPTDLAHRCQVVLRQPVQQETLFRNFEFGGSSASFRPRAHTPRRRRARRRAVRSHRPGSTSRRRFPG